MDTIYIPANYTDAGKLLGFFAVRHVAEAAVLGIPSAVLIFSILPFDLVTKIIVCAVVVVPLCGFALLGIYDYSLLTFLRVYRAWRKSRRILTYRGLSWLKPRQIKRLARKA